MCASMYVWARRLVGDTSPEIRPDRNMSRSPDPNPYPEQVVDLKISRVVDGFRYSRSHKSLLVYPKNPTRYPRCGHIYDNPVTYLKAAINL